MSEEAGELAQAFTIDRRSAHGDRVEVITGRERRRAWTTEQKLQIVGESLEAGASPIVVARRHGIGSGLLYTWRQQLLRGEFGAVAQQPAPSFARVDVLPAAARAEMPAAVSSEPASVELPNTEQVGGTALLGQPEDRIEIVLSSGGFEPSHRHKPGSSKVSAESETVTPAVALRGGNCGKAPENLECDGVTVSEPSFREKRGGLPRVAEDAVEALADSDSDSAQAERREIASLPPPVTATVGWPDEDTPALLDWFGQSARPERPSRTWGGQWTSHVEWREADVAGNRAARDHDVLSVLFSPQVLDGLCGNKSNASSEVEFYGLHATMLGDEGRGIRTIIEMAHVTRLDFAIGSAGLMRQALSQAIHHTSNRRAFQRNLVDLPIMRNVVADLAVESEAMMWMSMRLAAALDRAGTNRAEGLLSRICTPVAKYWACKRAPAFVAEALECHGGNGFIADHLMERLYREAPLNGIWEGTGNVICLDVLRSMTREPETVGVFLDELRTARGGNARLDSYADDLVRRLADPAGLEPVARRVVEMMAFALQASLLVRYSSPAVADAFCATRLDGDWGQAFGTMPSGLDTQAIVDRARLGGN